MAVSIFSLSAMPTTNTKKAVKNTTNSATLSPKDKKAKRELAIMERKNSVWNSNNGGGRICYH